MKTDASEAERARQKLIERLSVLLAGFNYVPPGEAPKLARTLVLGLNLVTVDTALIADIEEVELQEGAKSLAERVPYEPARLALARSVLAQLAEDVP